MADIKEIESDQPDDVKEKEETKEPEEEVVDSNGKLSSKSSDISIEEIGAEESNAEKNENAEVLIPEVVQEPAPVVAVEGHLPDDEDLDEDEEEDDFEDETLIERLQGLTEMFPEGLTSTVAASAKGLVSGRLYFHLQRTYTKPLKKINLSFQVFTGHMEPDGH